IESASPVGERRRWNGYDAVNPIRQAGNCDGRRELPGESAEHLPAVAVLRAEQELARAGFVGHRGDGTSERERTHDALQATAARRTRACRARRERERTSFAAEAGTHRKGCPARQACTQQLHARKLLFA